MSEHVAISPNEAADRLASRELVGLRALRGSPRREKSDGSLCRRRTFRAKREGDLPKNSDPAELARYVMTVLQGMAVQAAGGASRNQLSRVAQIALRAWPKD